MSGEDGLFLAPVPQSVIGERFGGEQKKKKVTSQKAHLHNVYGDIFDSEEITYLPPRAARPCQLAPRERPSAREEESVSSEKSRTT